MNTTKCSIETEVVMQYNVFVLLLFVDRFDGQVRHYKLYYEDGYHFVGEDLA